MADDNNYQVDKVAIHEHQTAIAAEKLEDIEQKCEINPVAFLRANYDYVKVRDRKTEPVFWVTLSVMLAKICALAGIKNKIDSFNADDINKMILSSCADLTLEEIYKAFELERYGTYEAKTDHFGLFNAEYVAAVIKKYRKWKQDTKIHHNISPPQSLPEVTEANKEEILLKGIIRVFNEYKNSKILPEPNAYIFDALYEKRLIRDAQTDGELMYYKKKFAQAQKEVQAELKSENVGSTGDVRQVREELDKIINGNSDKVFVRTKRLILKDYFDKLINENVEIENVLK